MLARLLALCIAPSASDPVAADATGPETAADANGANASAPAVPQAPAAPGLGIGLRWAAPPECATEAELRADVEALAARPLTTPSATMTVDATVAALDGGFRLHLERRTADGTLIEARDLDATECRVLTRATALIVAVWGAPLAVSAQVAVLEAKAASDFAVDGSNPGLDPPRSEDVRDPAPEVRAPIARTRSPPPRPTNNERPPTRRLPNGWRHRAVFGGLFGLSVGAVPSATLAIAGVAGYALGPLRLELSGTHAFARTRDVESEAAVEVRSSGGGATFVFAPRWGPLVVMAGVGVSAGVIQGAAQGRRVISAPTRDWWASVPIVAGVAWPPTSRVALRAQAALAIAARRPAIVIDRPSGGDIGGFRHPPVSFAALVGPEIRLP